MIAVGRVAHRAPGRPVRPAPVVTAAPRCSGRASGLRLSVMAVGPGSSRSSDQAQHGASLGGSLAANSGMLQLSAAVASLTFVLVIGVKGLLGLGPAIVLASGALAALPAGRAMDRFGRVPVLAAGLRDRDDRRRASRRSGAPWSRRCRSSSGWSASARRAGRRCSRARPPATCTRRRGVRVGIALRPRRRGLRRDPRPGRLQPAPLGPRARRRLARAPLARGLLPS